MSPSLTTFCERVVQLDEVAAYLKSSKLREVCQIEEAFCRNGGSYRSRPFNWKMKFALPTAFFDTSSKFAHLETVLML